MNNIELNCANIDFIIDVIARYLRQYQDVTSKPIFIPSTLDDYIDTNLAIDKIKYGMEHKTKNDTGIVEIVMKSRAKNGKYSEKFLIPEDLGRFMLTHTIKKEFREIPFFNNKINKVFWRAIWDVCVSIAHEKNDKLVFTDGEYKDFIHLLDGFVLMSEPIREDVYIYEFKKQIYNYVMNELPSGVGVDDITIDVPIHIFNTYKSKKYPDILPDTSLAKIGYPAHIFFDRLCKKFENDIVPIGLIISKSKSIRSNDDNTSDIDNSKYIHHKHIHHKHIHHKHIHHKHMHHKHIHHKHMHHKHTYHKQNKKYTNRILDCNNKYDILENM